jgi:hypothetical protein
MKNHFAVSCFTTSLAAHLVPDTYNPAPPLEDPRTSSHLISLSSSHRLALSTTIASHLFLELMTAVVLALPMPLVLCFHQK